MNKLVAGSLITTLFFSNMVSAGITVAPDTIELDLIGGDTITLPFNITWDGKTAVVGFIETTITPDGEGINISYSEGTIIILFPNEKKPVDMTISAAINLAPGNYTITTNIYTDVEEYVRTVYNTITEYITVVENQTIYVENETQINELKERIGDLLQNVNLTDEEKRILQIAVDDLNDKIDKMNQELKESKKRILAWIVFLTIIICIIILASYLIYRRYSGRHSLGGEKK